ncbi:MAG TPA: glycosyltransferase family 39 protein [Oculatellaceae cyanobacterium]
MTVNRSAVNALLAFTGVLLVGIALRIVYSYCVPSMSYEHDSVSHEQYIRFVARWAIIPKKTYCFVCYHPPLYYFLAAPVYKLALLLSGNDQWSMQTITSKLSLVCAIVAAICSSFAVRELLPNQESAWWRSLCLALVLCFPGLFYLGHSINNDALLMTLSFWLFWRLLLFARTSTLKNWRWIEVLNVAAFWTKSNALLLIATSLIVLLLNKKLDLGKRASLLFEQIAVLLTTCGPYVWWRTAVDSQDSLVGNWLHIPDPWYLWNRLYFFNPEYILSHPFIANPLAKTTKFPENFWDILYRTSFFGEWEFPCRTLAVYLELCGLVLLCFAAGGIVFEFCRRKVNVAALTTILVQVGGIWFYRMQIGWHCAFVDFRYIPIVILPIAYYTVLGIHKSPIALKIFGLMLAIEFLVLSFAVFPFICSS